MPVCVLLGFRSGTRQRAWHSAAMFAGLISVGVRNLKPVLKLLIAPWVEAMHAAAVSARIEVTFYVVF